MGRMESESGDYRSGEGFDSYSNGRSGGVAKDLALVNNPELQ
jgi:hypothetical protein